MGNVIPFKKPEHKTVIDSDREDRIAKAIKEISDLMIKMENDFNK